MIKNSVEYYDEPKGKHLTCKFEFDKRKFADKLNRQMDKHNMNNYDVFSYLYPDKASTAKDEKQKRDVSQKIYKWRNAENVPDLNVIVGLCDLFDCDFDYFIGDQDEERKTFSHASEYIGLQYSTIEKLSNLDDYQKDLIDCLCDANMGSDKAIDALLNIIGTYLKYVGTSQITIKSDYFPDGNWSGKQAVSLLKAGLEKDFDKVLDALHINDHCLEAVKQELNKELSKQRELILKGTE